MSRRSQVRILPPPLIAPELSLFRQIAGVHSVEMLRQHGGLRLNYLLHCKRVSWCPKVSETTQQDSPVQVAGVFALCN